MNSAFAVAVLIGVLAVILAVAFFVVWSRDAKRNDAVADDESRLDTENGPGVGPGSANSYNDPPSRG